MRIFLLPISTRRTLIYCERVQEAVKSKDSNTQQPISERIIHRASSTWAQWEKAEKGWQKRITVYGNQLFKRLPYEEWGLKSFPPATKKRLEEIERGEHKFECLYPGKFIKDRSVTDVLKQLATERQALHRKRLFWSIALMPVSAPFTLVPIIPNLPFFWLCFRAYSHYRALYGGKLLDHITQKGLVRSTDSKLMDELYADGLQHPTREASREVVSPSDDDIARVLKTVEEQKGYGSGDAMLLHRWNGKLIAEAFDLPELEIEIERAVEQVEKTIKANAELTVEKKELEQATGQKSGDIDESKR